MRVLVIRHHEEDSAAFLGEVFAARGAELADCLFPAAGPLPPPEQADFLLVLGATASVYDHGQAWIAEELGWLRRADAAGVPVLGVCFGAQALAAAFGGQVLPAARKEIGWTTVQTADPALVPEGPWLEFHGDQCIPPPQARVLARNGLGVQAFRLRRHLGVQFHPEVDAALLARWLDAGGRAEAAQAGCDPDEFLAATRAAEPAARDRAAHLVTSAMRVAQEGGWPGAARTHAWAAASSVTRACRPAT